jgi:hypothetical protein
MAKLIAGRMADNWGMTADKKGEAVQKQVVDKQCEQFDTVVDIDVQNGEITKPEGEKRKKKYRGVFAGMSREEFSSFLWDWGASMMANGKEGWGAVGQAGSDAMGAHRARIKEDEASELAATELTRTSGLEERAQLADTSRAASSASRAESEAKRAAAYDRNVDAVRGGVGEWKLKFYRSIGWSDEKIAQAAEGILTPEHLYDEISRNLRDERAEAASSEKMNLPDSMRAKRTLPDGTKVPTAELTDDQIDDMAFIASEKSIKKRGALGGNNAGKPALVEEPPKSTEDYLNIAQTGK